MNKLQSKDKWLILGLLILSLIAVVRDNQIVNDLPMLWIVLIFILSISVVINLFSRREIHNEFVNIDLHRAVDFRQTESLIGIYAILRPNMLLPHTREWAAPPDFLQVIVEVFAKTRPDYVVEASSGISTIICGYAMKRFGISGKVVSLEHDLIYVEKTQQLVIEHGLQDVITVIHAPLVVKTHNAQKTMWYDTSAMPSLLPNKKIKLLIIDGPPGDIEECIRWPAVPNFFNDIDIGGVILLHDAARPDEQNIVKRWLVDFPQLTCEELPCETGVKMFTKHK